MSQPEIAQPQPALVEKKNMSLLIRGALWIAIGALIAAALVCVIWVLIGDQDGLIGRAFLTILLLAGFAGIAILEASLAPNRPDWLALSSMVTWIIALIVGAVKIWLPEDDEYFGGGERFFQLLLVVGILQLALLHARLFTPAARRHVTTFTRIIYIATLVFLGALAAMLIFFLTFPDTFEFGELYWRIVVALTILAAVGTTLIPLLNALFAPKKPTQARDAVGAAPSWPTYADGRTPLPVLLDGSPDWNAYYTGYPTQQQQQHQQQLQQQQQLPPVPQQAAGAPQQSQGAHFPVAPEPFAPAPTAQAPVPAPAAPAPTDAPQSPFLPPPPAQGDGAAFPPAPPMPPR